MSRPSISQHPDLAVTIMVITDTWFLTVLCCHLASIISDCYHFHLSHGTQFYNGISYHPSQTAEDGHYGLLSNVPAPSPVHPLLPW